MMKIGQMRKTGNAAWPEVWLCKGCQNTYKVMLLSFDEEEGKANGWVTAAAGSLKHCRKFIDSMQG